MKILIGAHGTGKTTLLNYIQEKNPDIYVSDGFSRPVKQISFLGEHGRQDIINQLTYWRWKEDISKRNCLFGRSIIDSIIYSKILFGTTLDINYLQLEFDNSYQQVEKYFYIPIEFAIVNDGVRPVDVKFQQQIRDELENFIEKYQLPVIKLTGSVEERYNIIKKHL